MVAAILKNNGNPKNSNGEGERLQRICFIDYDREMALAAEYKKGDGSPEIIAIGRLSRLRGREEGRWRCSSTTASSTWDWARYSISA